jgi:hypothetical protein
MQQLDTSFLDIDLEDIPCGQPDDTSHVRYPIFRGSPTVLSPSDGNLTAHMTSNPNDSKRARAGACAACR